MVERSGVLLEHVRSTIGNVVLAGQSAPMRVAQARSVSEAVQDLADAFRAGQVTLRVGRVDDLFRAATDPDAAEREAMRAGLGELRDLEHFGGLLPRPVFVDGATGYGPCPLVRSVARRWEDMGGLTPVVPGFATGGPFAEVDPELPMEDEDALVIENVGASEDRHASILTAASSRQVLDFITRAGQALLDEIVLDEVDLAAETFIATKLVSEAGGTRAAGADLPGALDEAEAAAGARGPVQFVVVNALDWPAVRRALASTFFAGPHPDIVVSAGQPTGSVTFAGSGGVVLLANDYAGVATMRRPKTFEQELAVARPFYVSVREEDLVQTVTGIGEASEEEE